MTTFTSSLNMNKEYYSDSITRFVSSRTAHDQEAMLIHPLHSAKSVSCEYDFECTLSTASLSSNNNAAVVHQDHPITSSSNECYEDDDNEDRSNYCIIVDNNNNVNHHHDSSLLLHHGMVVLDNDDNSFSDLEAAANVSTYDYSEISLDDDGRLTYNDDNDPYYVDTGDNSNKNDNSSNTTGPGPGPSLIPGSSNSSSSNSYYRTTCDSDINTTQLPVSVGYYSFLSATSRPVLDKMHEIMRDNVVAVTANTNSMATKGTDINNKKTTMTTNRLPCAIGMDGMYLHTLRKLHKSMKQSSKSRKSILLSSTSSLVTINTRNNNRTNNRSSRCTNAYKNNKTTNNTNNLCCVLSQICKYTQESSEQVDACLETTW
jgi:hypothetical protein